MEYQRRGTGNRQCNSKDSSGSHQSVLSKRQFSGQWSLRRWALPSRCSVWIQSQRRKGGGVQRCQQSYNSVSALFSKALNRDILHSSVSFIDHPNHKSKSRILTQAVASDIPSIKFLFRWKGFWSLCNHVRRHHHFRKRWPSRPFRLAPKRTHFPGTWSHSRVIEEKNCDPRRAREKSSRYCSDPAEPLERVNSQTLETNVGRSLKGRNEKTFGNEGKGRREKREREAQRETKVSNSWVK